VIFIDTKTNRKIVDLGKWTEEKSKDAALMAKLEKKLKPFSDKFGTVTSAQRQQAVSRLNEMSVLKLQTGADASGVIRGNPIEKAALRAKAVLEKKSASVFTVTENLSKVKNNKCLDYPNVLPPNAGTIVVNQGGKRTVCVRMIDNSVDGGGRVAYFNLMTGKRVKMKIGVKLQIVSALSIASKEYKAVVAQETENTKPLIKKGYVWVRNSEKPEKVAKKSTGYSGGGSYSGGGGYSGGGSGGYSGGGGGAPSYQPSTPTPAPTGPPVTATPSKNPLVKSVENKELAGTPIEKVNGWPTNLEVKHVELPTKRLFCTLIKPKQQPKPGQKVVTIAYCTGKGNTREYTSWRESRSKLKPPANVAEAITKKYFTSQSKKEAIEWHAKMAKQGIYPVIAFMTDVHTDKANKSSTWYKDWESAQTVQGIFDTIFGAVQKAVPKAKVSKEIMFAGHSMGGKAAYYLTEFIRKGKLSGFKLRGTCNLDASYWLLGAQIKLARETGMRLFLSTRSGTKTASQAFRIIEAFGLAREGKKTPKRSRVMHKRKYKNKKEEQKEKYIYVLENGIYTNPAHPNVRVEVATGVGHSKHASMLGKGFEQIMAT